MIDGEQAEGHLLPDKSRIVVIREQFKCKPSIDDLVESGEYLPPITMGEYFDRVRRDRFRELHLPELTMNASAPISGDVR